MEGENRGGPHAARVRGSRADEDWDRFPPDASARAPRETLRHARQASRDSSADGTPRADLCSPGRFWIFFWSGRGRNREIPTGRSPIHRSASIAKFVIFRSDRTIRFQIPDQIPNDEHHSRGCAWAGTQW